MFRLGYNTNGLAHHRVLDALRLLADLGYEGVAITPDVGGLDLLELDRRLVADARRWAEELGLELAIETGARFALDARRKHRPTLLEDEPEERLRRIDYLLRAVELVASGGGVRNPDLMRRLAAALAPVTVVTSDERGLSSDYKEAIAFALLASARIDGIAGNVPEVTGAVRSVPLGKITEC